MYKIVTLSLALAATAVLLAEPVTAGAEEPSIVVTPAKSHAQFVATVSRDLDDQLEAASRYPYIPFGEGITKVRFTRTADGTPENVTIFRKSGIRTLDRIARRAVSNLRSLDDVPADIGPDQVYQANIVFASNFERAEELQEQLMAEETARFASDPSERRVFAFGSAAARPSS